jgi:hypothetical protein
MNNRLKYWAQKDKLRRSYKKTTRRLHKQYKKILASSNVFDRKDNKLDHGDLIYKQFQDD